MGSLGVEPGLRERLACGGKEGRREAGREGGKEGWMEENGARKAGRSNLSQILFSCTDIHIQLVKTRRREQELESSWNELLSSR